MKPSTRLAILAVAGSLLAPPAVAVATSPPPVVSTDAACDIRCVAKESGTFKPRGPVYIFPPR